jgi:hypothetical protein
MKNKKYLPWSKLPLIAIPKICSDSQKRVWSKLINQACGMKADAEGNLDPEQYYLSMVGSTGTALSVGGLRWFLGGVVPVRFKNGKGSVYDETLQPDVVLLPDKGGLWASEARLNRFLIRLGKALTNKKKRGKPLWIPDWSNNVKRTLNYIVQGWCESIIVNNETWPPLCCLTYGALAKFLTLCETPVGQGRLWSEKHPPRTLETEIQRLGLVAITKGKIKDVEKKFGEFRFC